MGTQSTVSAVEIVMSWNGTVLESDLVELARPRSVLVGSEGAVRFLVPEEVLPSRSAELLAVENGRFFLRAPAGATLVAGKDGVAIEPALDATGGLAIELVPGVCGEVKIGELAFFARMVGDLSEASAPTAFDFHPLRWIGAVVAVHAAILGSLLFAPPDASAMNLDLSRDSARYIEAHLSAPVPIAELLPELHAAADGGGGTATGDDSPSTAGGGVSGDTHTTTGGPGRPTAHAEIVRGPVTAATVNSLAMWSGMASIFANPGTDTGAFGSDSLDVGPGGAGLYAALAAGEGGSGGPEMNGTGIGTCTGEHCGEGTIGVGPLSTHSGPVGPGPSLHERPAGHGPEIRELAATTTAGGLGREEIRRVMRIHRRDVYSCLEAELRGGVPVDGRVTLAFQIDTSGNVHNARVVGSDGNTAEVGACVAHSLANWSFPTAPGATGVVGYPFVFDTGE